MVGQVQRAFSGQQPVKLDRMPGSDGQALTFDGGGISLGDWIFMLKDINPDHPGRIKTNARQFNTDVVDGQDTEMLTD